MDDWIEEQLFRKIRRALPIATVDALIVNNNRLLLMKRRNPPMNGVWWIPGGRLLKGESLENAVLREVYEETGLKGKILRKVGVINQVFSEYHTVSVFFLVTVSSDKVMINDEHSAFRWVSKLPEQSHEFLQRMVKESCVFRSTGKRESK